jgi:acyl-CoA reductase-like NAD-dependent aldehyde dehydrogenase
VDDLEPRELTVCDPATGMPVTTVKTASAAECVAAVRAARAAAPAWARTPPAERGAALRTAADAVAAAAAELAELTCRETGKPLLDARGGVDAAVATLRQYAELGPLHRGRSLQGGWDATDLMVACPRGVAVVLTPWNDPVAVAAGLVGAALAVGNTVVHKPSERCPATGRRFAELVAAAVPDGVLSVLDGDGAVGAALAAEPVDVIAHVGSSATGAAIAAAAATTGAHLVLENGGNDALIVDADVDVGWAAGQAALGAFANAGQICVSVERILVHADLAAEFVDALVAEAETWSGRIGPLVDRRHRTHVHTQVSDAIAGGARARCGGTLPGGAGSWYPPVVLTECEPGMAVWSEETFGPVAPVRVVPDFATAVQEAAADRFGLGATVLTADMAHAQTAWRELPVGTVKVNSVFGGAPGGAAHPRGASGRGFGFGPELLDEMAATKVVHVSPAPAPRRR